jgi:hypothetical protein
VACRVDAAREAGYDGKAGKPEIACENGGEAAAGGRSVSRPDERNCGPNKRFKLSANGEKRGRVVGLAQARRIIVLADRHKADSDFGRSFDFGLCVGLACNAYFTPPATARQLGHARKRPGRSAKFIDQCAKGSRSDVLGANQAQPVDPLLVG